MTIEKKSLLEDLQLCMPGIETGQRILEGADTFVFDNGFIHTYNDVISVRVPISQQGLLEESISGAVSANEFFKVISKMPSDEIKFSITENNSWLLKSGRAKVEMALHNFDFESRLQKLQPTDDWQTINGDDFISALAGVRMTVNKTSLSGAFISGKEIYSTDGNQVNKYDLADDYPVFWISDKALAELLKLKNINALQLQDNWLHFRTENDVIFSVKTLQAENFPIGKIEKLFKAFTPQETDLHATLPSALFAAVERAVPFSTCIDDYSTICITLSPENLKVSSATSAGNYSEKIDWDSPIESEFSPIDIYVDTTMLQYIAKRGTEFFLKGGLSEGAKIKPQLLFVTANSRHLFATFAGKN